jgi:hypothetical protein
MIGSFVEVFADEVKSAWEFRGIRGKAKARGLEAVDARLAD